MEARRSRLSLCSFVLVYDTVCASRQAESCENLSKTPGTNAPSERREHPMLNRSYAHPTRCTSSMRHVVLFHS